MQSIIAILSSVIFATGLIIASRQMSATAQLVIGIILMVIALVIGLR